MVPMPEPTYRRYHLRSLEATKKYLSIEWAVLKKDWVFLLLGALMQCVHSIGTNLAYYIQNKLSTEQRFALYDLGYELMPALSSALRVISEVLVFGGVFFPVIVLAGSITLFKQNPKCPRYLVVILKRVLLTLSIGQIFRILSFLGTALPGPAPHCQPNFDPVCMQSNPRSPAECAIPNPEFIPPNDIVDILFRIDIFNGCGDLLFSSHTIYTLTFIMTMSKYWYNIYLVVALVCLQIAIAFLIIAGRKHYTVDVFTALYVMPMIWFLLEAYHYDINHKDIGISVQSMKKFYGVDISEDLDFNLDQDDEADPAASSQEAPYTNLQENGDHDIAVGLTSESTANTNTV